MMIAILNKTANQSLEQTLPANCRITNVMCVFQMGFLLKCVMEIIAFQIVTVLLTNAKRQYVNTILQVYFGE